MFQLISQTNNWQHFQRFWTCRGYFPAIFEKEKLQRDWCQTHTVCMYVCSTHLTKFYKVVQLIDWLSYIWIWSQSIYLWFTMLEIIWRSCCSDRHILRPWDRSETCGLPWCRVSIEWSDAPYDMLHWHCCNMVFNHVIIHIVRVSV